MLVWIASVQPERGKGRELLAWCKEAAAAINQGFGPARPAEVLTELFGEQGRIHIAMGLKDLAPWASS